MRCMTANSVKLLRDSEMHDSKQCEVACLHITVLFIHGPRFSIWRETGDYHPGPPFCPDKEAISEYGVCTIAASKL